MSIWHNLRFVSCLAFKCEVCIPYVDHTRYTVFERHLVLFAILASLRGYNCDIDQVGRLSVDGDLVLRVVRHIGKAILLPLASSSHLHRQNLHHLLHHRDKSHRRHSHWNPCNLGLGLACLQEHAAG